MIRKIGFTIILTFVYLLLCEQYDPDFYESDAKITELADSLYSDSLYCDLDSDSLYSDFFDSLKVKASQIWITKEIHNALISDIRKEFIKKESGKLTKAGNIYAKHNGKTINNIRIKKIEIFGQTLNDTLSVPNSFLENLGNSVHVKTKDNIIRNKILVNTNDKFNSILISDNERLIRNLEYIDNARFFITDDNKDSCNLLLITQDKWSKELTASITSDNYSINLIDNNFLGYGLRFNNYLSYHENSSRKFGYKGVYNLGSIFNNFINADIKYNNTPNLSSYGFSISRSFISPAIPYAGGIEFSHTNNKSENSFNNNGFDYFDLWAGKSYNLRSYSENIYFQARYNNKKFYKRIYTDRFSNRLLHNRKNMLFSVTLRNRDYYKGDLLYQFDVVQDIPVGYLIELNTGLQFGEYYNKVYSSFRFSSSLYKQHFGYLSFQIEAGGFRTNKKLEQGTLKSNINYFSNLYNLFERKNRTFISLEYINGVNRYKNEQLLFNHKDFTYPDNKINGIKRLSSSFENVIFMPWYYYGFKSSLFSFFQAGMIGKNKLENFHYGIGGGVRFRNNRLAIKNFEIRFTFYPAINDDFSPFILNLERARHYTNDNLDVKPPHFIEFE